MAFEGKKYEILKEVLLPTLNGTIFPGAKLLGTPGRSMKMGIMVYRFCYDWA